MATTIDIEIPYNKIKLRDLTIGDSFVIDGELFMVRGPATKIICGELRETGEITATRMLTGQPKRFLGGCTVEPVDIEIKVVRK